MFATILYTIVIFICVLCTLADSEEAAPYKYPSGERATNDYREVTKGVLYKVHSEPRSWHDAYQYCSLEGASLFYPESLPESKLIIELLQESYPKGAESWVGAHDLFSTSSFVDLYGTLISKNYAPWGSNKPSRGGYPGNCVMMHPDGSIEDQPCHLWRPFVCKKWLPKTTYYDAACDTFYQGYVRYKDSDSCYKVHKEPKGWVDAYMTCEAEKSYLAVIDNKEEADYIVGEIKAVFDEVPGNYNRTLISIGFHDKFKEGIYLTINGKSLSTVYNNWADDQPDDQWHQSNCGALSVTGQLHDISCDRDRTLFICEHDISNLIYLK